MGLVVLVLYSFIVKCYYNVFIRFVYLIIREFGIGFADFDVDDLYCFCFNVDVIVVFEVDVSDISFLRVL